MKSRGTAQGSKQIDERFMRLAIKEAARALGKTGPNPAVGAVIVKNGRLLSKGFHHSAWGSPAEWWKPLERRRPFFTMTAPTAGFGAVLPIARAASLIAKRMKRSSICLLPWVVPRDFILFVSLLFD